MNVYKRRIADRYRRQTPLGACALTNRTTALRQETATLMSISALVTIVIIIILGLRGSFAG